jgi:hypothetical protein
LQEAIKHFVVGYNSGPKHFTRRAGPLISTKLVMIDTSQTRKIARIGFLKPATYVLEEKEQDYRNELSGALRVSLKM